MNQGLLPNMLTTAINDNGLEVAEEANTLTDFDSTNRIENTMGNSSNITFSDYFPSMEGAGAGMLAPMVAANEVTSGLIHANNMNRDAEAQRSPNFDAQYLANKQDAVDETVGAYGMGATAALGATLGPVGVALGVTGTAIAEAFDNVSPNQTMSTAGTMSNAADGT